MQQWLHFNQIVIVDSRSSRRAQKVSRQSLSLVFKKLPFQLNYEWERAEKETNLTVTSRGDSQWFPTLVPSSACLEPSSRLPQHKRESRLACSSVSCLNSTKSDGKEKLFRRRKFLLVWKITGRGRGQESKKASNIVQSDSKINDAKRCRNSYSNLRVYGVLQYSSANVEKCMKHHKIWWDTKIYARRCDRIRLVDDNSGKKFFMFVFIFRLLWRL